MKIADRSSWPPRLRRLSPLLALLVAGAHAGCGSVRAPASDRARLEYVASVVQRLTAPELEGRLAGTPGGDAAAAFLRGELARRHAEILETPPVPVRAVQLARTPSLAVGDRIFRHREDFNDWPYYSRSGTVEGRLWALDGAWPPPVPSGEGGVVLIRATSGVRMSAELAAEAHAKGFVALLIENEQRSIELKSAVGGEGALPVLYLTPEAAEAVAARRGAPVRIELPLQNVQRTSRNVVGLLRRAPGPDAPTYLLTAHYDHVGDDAGGLRFPGAFDNASGVAVLLETARLYQARPAPSFNLLVAFTTGEESGLYGAKSLVAQPPASFAAAVNVDGVGSQPALSAMRMGQTEPLSPFAALAQRVLASRGIEARWWVGSDDSSVFRSAGIPFVGLGEEPIAPIPIHTPKDLPERLNLASLPQTAALLLELFEQAGAPPPPSGSNPGNAQPAPSCGGGGREHAPASRVGAPRGSP
jgi:aminopeptidase YwaD